MINIEFTPQQVEELKIYYNAELVKIEKRANEIKEILEKFNGKKTIITPALDQVELQNNSEKKDNKIEDINIEKLENKSWSSIILNVLEQSGKPIYKNEIYKQIKQIKGIELTKNNISVINQTIYNLIKTQGKIESIKKKGKKEKLYKLTNKTDNQIKPIIAEKFIKEKKIKLPKIVIESAKNIEIKPKEKASKSYWPDFINGVLEQNQRLMESKEILDIAMKQFNIQESQRENYRSRLSPALTRLVKETKTLNSIKRDGIQAILYGLSGWFEKNGELKSKYKLSEEKLTKIIKPLKSVTLEKKTTQLKEKKGRISRTINYNWPSFIIELLDKNQRPMQMKEFVLNAMEKYNYPESRRDETRGKVSPALSRLENDSILKAIKIGNIIGSYYCLPTWFNDKGELLPKYIDSELKENAIKERDKNVENSRSIWPAFIIDTLKAQNKFLKANQIVDIAMNKFNIPKEKKGQARSSITSSISVVKNTKNLIKSISLKGSNSKFYGLNEWFDENGKLKTEYKKIEV